MKYTLIIIVISLLSAFTLADNNLLEGNQKRVNKTLNKLWVESTILTNEIKGVSTKIESKYFELYTLKVDSKDTGFLYFTEAPSKVETFVYMIVFNPDLTIKHTQVLEYRENYGAEIMSKRFLKQFAGKSNGEGLEFNKDIDGVSGATISSHSITNSVKKATLNVSELRKLKLI